MLNTEEAVPKNESAKPNTTQNHTPVKNDGPQIGRNEPCSCGSGKKYKNCCGK